MQSVKKTALTGMFNFRLWFRLFFLSLHSIFKRKMREPYDREIAVLRQMIEQSIRRSIITPADFAFLRETIAVRCQDTLSDSTLKRIWGYVKGYSSTNAATLSLLARCVGFREKSHIGKALADTSNWDYFYSDNPHLQHSPGHDQASNNATGFSALGAGNVIGSPENYFHQSAYFWTSSEFSSFQAPYRYVDHDMPVFGINYDSHKRTGRSVRCVKNL